MSFKFFTTVVFSFMLTAFTGNCFAAETQDSSMVGHWRVISYCDQVEIGSGKQETVCIHEADSAENYYDISAQGALSDIMGWAHFCTIYFKVNTGDCGGFTFKVQPRSLDEMDFVFEPADDGSQTMMKLGRVADDKFEQTRESYLTELRRANGLIAALTGKTLTLVKRIDVTESATKPREEVVTDAKDIADKTELNYRDDKGIDHHHVDYAPKTLHFGANKQVRVNNEYDSTYVMGYENNANDLEVQLTFKDGELSEWGDSLGQITQNGQVVTLVHVQNGLSYEDGQFEEEINTTTYVYQISP